MEKTIRHQNKIAVVDLGTNSALLLLARRAGRQLISLHEEARTPRLGAGLATDGVIADRSIGKLIKIIRDYQKTCLDFGVEQMVAVGTRVFRAAGNSRKVILRVKQETGIQIQVLSAKQEAAFALRGALTDLRKITNGILVDIGGGSTELVLFRRRELVSSVSLPLGALILAETELKRFWHISPARLARVGEYVGKFLQNLPPGYQQTSGKVIAVGGTATTLAALNQRLRKYQPQRVGGYVLKRSATALSLRRFRLLTTADLAQIIPYDPARARVLPAGTFILNEVLNHLCASQAVVAHRGLRWGVADSYFRNSGEWLSRKFA